VGTALLVLVTVGITLLGNLVQRSSGKLGELIGFGAGPLAGGLVHAASFVLSIVVVLLLYRFVPPRGLRLRDGLVGAILTALLLRLIALASGWIYERTTRLSVVYGSLTSALVFQYSMYLYSCALLLGAEVAVAWSRPQRADGGPILTQLKSYSESSSGRGCRRPKSRLETHARTARRAHDRRREQPLILAAALGERGEHLRGVVHLCGALIVFCSPVSAASAAACPGRTRDGRSLRAESRQCEHRAGRQPRRDHLDRATSTSRRGGRSGSRPVPASSSSARSWGPRS
jgi:hypothetical protein